MLTVIQSNELVKAAIAGKAVHEDAAETRERAGVGVVERPAALPPGVAQHTGIVLYKVAQFAQDLLDQALAARGLKTRHFSVLAVLVHGPRSQQALGTKLRIDRATMVKIVDDLERRGLVERRRNAADRRLYDLTVTVAGREEVAIAGSAVAASEAVLFAPLDAAQRKRLHELLARLLDDDAAPVPRPRGPRVDAPVAPVDA